MLSANKNIDRLERDLRQAILAGTLAPSSRLISVRSLADQYGLTYGRTLRALKRLEKQGMLVARHGGGTYVADSVIAKSAPLQRSDSSETACAIIVAPENYWTGGDGLWFAEFIRGFETHLGESGANLKIVARSEYVKNVAQLTPSARTQIILCPLDDEQLESIRAHQGDPTTFVLVAFDPLHSDWALVMDVDGPSGIRHGVDALGERGHSEISLLSWVMPETLKSQWWWLAQREAAYEEVIKKSQRKASIIHVPFPGLDTPAPEQRRAIDDCIAAALKKRSRPTGLLCVNDLLARFAMDWAVRHKIKIPEDLSILGFDDDPWSVTRGLSTFHRPYRELGQMAGELAIQNQRQARARWRGSLMIEPRLILRSSIGVARL